MSCEREEEREDSRIDVWRDKKKERVVVNRVEIINQYEWRHRERKKEIERGRERRIETKRRKWYKYKPMSSGRRKRDRNQINENLKTKVFF